MRAATILLSWVCLLFTAGGVSAAEPSSKPNILLIVADVLGWSDVGWHGGLSKTQSPPGLAGRRFSFGKGPVHGSVPDGQMWRFDSLAVLRQAVHQRVEHSRR